MHELLVRHGTLSFVVLVALISITSGLLGFRIGGPDTFSSPQAMPFLLLAIWAPNIAAIICAGAQGTLTTLLRGLTAGAPAQVWILALAPMAIALTAGLLAGLSEPLPAGAWLTLIAMNLIMGPLGEELGWRGYLLPRLLPELGSVGAALAVGVLWALWHLPLWLVPSPHAAISFPLFGATVVCLSIIMTALWQAGSGALWPMVLFHLAVNVGVGWLEATTGQSSNQVFRATLPFYAAGAVLSCVWLGYQTRGVCALD